jgi:hypothetical protein
MILALRLVERVMILLHVRVEVRVNAGDGAILLLLPDLLD